MTYGATQNDINFRRVRDEFRMFRDARAEDLPSNLAEEPATPVLTALEMPQKTAGVSGQ